jgi:RNA polymerase sigma factor (sigma-70 family)
MEASVEMKLYEGLTESGIAARIINGEKSLYEFIIRRFNADLYKIGRSYNYNHEDTQDLMQDTFIDAYKNLSTFEGRSSFKTWIIRIMLNNCYRKKQKASFKNEVNQEIQENSSPMFNSSNNDSGKLIQNRELGFIIERALGNIPEQYRLVFSLREMNGLSVSETAGLLNITTDNVKVRLNRAKSMMRKEIEKSYSPSELFEFNAIYCNEMTDKVMKLINELY